MRSLAAEGRTVMISSHLMSEMELTADRLVILGRGRLLADVSLQVMTASASGQIHVRSPHAAELAGLLTADGAVARPDGPDTLSVTGTTSTHIAETALATGLLLTELIPRHASLEEAYLALTEHETQYRAAAGDRPHRRRAP
jgi:ABC-2 type transport system ATP-binding protein